MFKRETKAWIALVEWLSARANSPDSAPDLPNPRTEETEEFIRQTSALSADPEKLNELQIAAAYQAILSDPDRKEEIAKTLSLSPEQLIELKNYGIKYLKELNKLGEKNQQNGSPILRIVQVGLVLFLIALLGLGSIAYYQYKSFARYIDSPASKKSGQTSFEIPKGATLSKVSEILKKAGVIEDTGKFYTFVRYHHYLKKLYPQLKHDGFVQLRAGKYTVKLPLTPREILAVLRKGPPRKAIKITIPEGFNIWKIAARLEKNKICRADDFINFVKDPKNVRRLLGWDAPSLEGYLFPDTYYFYKNTPPSEVAKRMVNRFKQVFNEQFKKRAREMGWTIHQVVTLASIIEKETGQAKERPLISSVFHNRLRRNWKLESDPTVIYGLLPNFNGNITQKDLHNPHPYNTYKHYGLPPGPIASPGLASIRAALYPPKTKYMFFVAKNDGSHVFSRTGKEHRRWVEIYQKRRRKKRN